jgi:hypothetical protein
MSSGENIYQQKLESIKSAARAEAQEEEIGEGGDVPKVSPLDPDFILIFIFAFCVDALDILTEIGIVAAGIPKIAGIGFDVITYLIIGGWVYAKTKKIVDSKKQQAENMGRQAQKLGKPFQKANPNRRAYSFYRIISFLDDNGTECLKRKRRINYLKIKICAIF